MITATLTGGLRLRFGEGKRGPLEQKIPALLEGLRRVAANMAEHREQSEARDREFRERERRRLKNEIIERDRRQFSETLVTQATAWHQSSLVEAFITEASRRAAECGAEEDPDFGQWCASAKAAAAALDPFASTRMPWERAGPTSR